MNTGTERLKFSLKIIEDEKEEAGEGGNKVNLAVMKWLNAIGCRWGKHTLDRVVMQGENLETLKWLLGIGCRWSK